MFDEKYTALLEIISSMNKFMSAKHPKNIQLLI